MLAMAVGIIVGPWMPQMPFWFSLTGPSIALVFLIITVLSIPIILSYSELTAMLPFAGGAYNFARNAFGSIPAWVTGWCVILLYVIATAFMAPATARMFQAFVGWDHLSEMTVALSGIAILFVFSFLNTFSVSASARLQTIMVLAMIVVGVTTFLWFFNSGQWSLNNVTPFFTSGLTGFTIAVGIMFVMVIGFDCVPQLAEEANYPERDMVWIMLGAVLFSQILFALICLANAGMMPTDWIVNQVVVSPEIARVLAGDWAAAVMNFAGLLATLTCLNGFMLAAARLVFAMGRARVLPPLLGQTNRYDSPYAAVWLVFLVCAVVVLVGGENWLETLFVGAAFAAGLVYVLTCMSAVALRIKQPHWPRPVRLPGGIAIPGLATLISIGVTVAVAFGMSRTSWTIVSSWMAFGVVVYASMAMLRRTRPGYEEIAPFTPADIEVAANKY